MEIERIINPNAGVPHIITKDEDGIFFRFVERLENNPNINLDNFYANVNTLNLYPVDSPEEMPAKTLMASYNLVGNELKYVRSYFQKTIDHELLHMASRVKGEKYLHCGFSQLDLDTFICLGGALNEAYTAILDERYFNDRTPDKPEYNKKVYPIVKTLVSNLENFVGRDYMETWFFEGNLAALVEELCKYTSFKRTIEFIVDLDIINNGTYDLERTEYDYRQMCKAIEDGISFVTEIGLYQAYYNYEAGNISLAALKDIAMSLLKYSKMCLVMTDIETGKKRFQTKPMTDERFFKLCKKTSQSAKKNVLLS